MTIPRQTATSGYLSRLLPIFLGVAITLTLSGYQFGTGNHTVYLIAPLREVHPELLKNDWWTTHTLQYHLAYTYLSAALMRLHIIKPAFLVFYLVMALVLHIAWLRITRTLGLGERIYLLSVLLFYLSAAGTGLGSYQFLQDSSFLPGNVANIAFLWGIAFWLEGRWRASAATFALASLFHLNHAIVALAFWPIAIFVTRRQRPITKPFHAIAGFTLILLFALPNIIPAAQSIFAAAPKIPLKEFVDLYVHLRHPHHYDPLSWPIALWLSFLWPIPLAILAYRRQPASAIRTRAALIFNFFITLQIIALLFAGIFFISEPLIQMSLFRFSIYPKLFSCIGAAALLLDPALLIRRAVRPILLSLPFISLILLFTIRFATAAHFIQTNLTPLLLFIALSTIVIFQALRSSSIHHLPSSILAATLLATLFLARNHLGLQLTLQDDGDRDYLALCAWSRDHTPADALFIVPPNEQLFRYHAQRAIVVNFKNIPQLSSEMPEWKSRLQAILDQPLFTFPHRYDLAHAAIAARYDSLSAPHLSRVAAKYGARYVVTARPLATRRACFENASYHLYDLADSPNSP